MDLCKLLSAMAGYLSFELPLGLQGYLLATDRIGLAVLRSSHEVFECYSSPAKVIHYIIFD
jgi:hypothetical protein